MKSFYFLFFLLGGLVQAETQQEKATLAGGCFWCMQGTFATIPGVIKTQVGYTDGHKKNPTYEEVSSGQTGHTEAIEITFDPKKISYEKILDIFWRDIDPTTVNKQFADEGTQYRTAIFYHSEKQKELALKSKDQLQKSKRFGTSSIVTEIKPASIFFTAEEYHQMYPQKNSLRYKTYRKFSGRDDYLKKVWGK